MFRQFCVDRVRPHIAGAVDVYNELKGKWFDILQAVNFYFKRRYRRYRWKLEGVTEERTGERTDGRTDGPFYKEVA